MFYTRGGYEVSRVTLVDFFTEGVLLDCLVLPRYGPVLDYNTRFSGITAEMYSADAGAGSGALQVFSFDQVKEMLARLIRPETILIGHSLENDLTVLEVLLSAVDDVVNDCFNFIIPSSISISVSVSVSSSSIMIALLTLPSCILIHPVPSCVLVSSHWPWRIFPPSSRIPAVAMTAGRIA